MRAGAGAEFELLGMGTGVVNGRVAVRDAWHALWAGLRALGIASKEDLAEWHGRKGYGSVALNTYLHVHVQVGLLSH